MHVLKRRAVLHADVGSPYDDAWCYVGVQEKRLGQKFVVDVTLHCSLRKAGLTDHLADSVDYAAVYRCDVKPEPGFPRRFSGLFAQTLTHFHAALLGCSYSVHERAVYKRIFGWVLTY